jgi:hypothetical protein
MPSSDYHFITHWRIKSTLEEISQIIGNAPDLVRWWSSVYLDVQELEAGDEQGIGKVVSVYTKGWLPYTLRWQFRVTESRYPHGFTLQAWGDFDGRGIWTFEQDGEWVNVTYDWKIRADKPLLRILSPVFKPIFSANHHWAMTKGEESLKLELARRRAATPQAQALVLAPPPPTTNTVPFPWAAMVVALVGAVFIFMRARR